MAEHAGPAAGTPRAFTDSHAHLSYVLERSGREAFEEALSGADPFESMAKAYLDLFIARSDQAKEDVMAGLLADFGADGVVYHDTKTCPNNSNNRYQMPQRLQAKPG